MKLCLDIRCKQTTGGNALLNIINKSQSNSNRFFLSFVSFPFSVIIYLASPLVETPTPNLMYHQTFFLLRSTQVQ